MIIKTQIYILLIIAILLYLIWAIAHHKKDKSLTLEVFIEYLLTAALSFVLILGVINS